jgi:hypothetical protein
VIGAEVGTPVTGASVGGEVGATEAGVGDAVGRGVIGAAVGGDVTGATVIDISVTILLNWSQSVWSLQKAGCLC